MFIVLEDFQLIIKTLKDTGILLALASKNEEKDVWNVFDNHNEMILKKEDIVISKINWLEKSENIKQISDELGLGLDSFVFWDDNPIEREKVKNSLPDVTVIEAPKEVFEWPEILSNLNEFSRFQITTEDTQKLEQYKSRAKFNKTKSDVNFDQKEFLKQIIFSAVDDFGDHGQIGLSFIKYDYDNKSAFLDTFLLSCRILGRDIELWMMQSILNKLNKDGITILEIEYLETERNGLVRSFLSECDSNFEKLYSSGKKIRLSTCDTIIDVHKMY